MKNIFHISHFNTQKIILITDEKYGDIINSSTYHLDRYFEFHLDNYPSKIPKDLKMRAIEEDQ